MGKQGCLCQKYGYSQKLQYKQYNGKKQKGNGGRVKDMKFSGVK